MSRHWHGGSTRAWREKRARVLLANARTNAGRCTLDVGVECAKHGRPCPGVCTGEASEVHHSRGKAYGDADAELQAVCKACNLHVGQPGQRPPDPVPVSKW